VVRGQSVDVSAVYCCALNMEFCHRSYFTISVQFKIRLIVNVPAPSLACIHSHWCVSGAAFATSTAAWCSSVTAAASALSRHRSARNGFILFMHSNVQSSCPLFACNAAFAAFRGAVRGAVSSYKPAAGMVPAVSSSSATATAIAAAATALSIPTYSAAAARE